MQDNKNANLRASVKLICRVGNEILLIRRIGNNFYNLVGGGVDSGEDLEQAIQREFLEETGNTLSCQDIKLLDVEIRIFPKGGQFEGVVNIFYLLNFDKKFETILESGVYEEYKWCDKNELLNIDVSEHSNKNLLLSLI